VDRFVGHGVASFVWRNLLAAICAIVAERKRHDAPLPRQRRAESAGIHTHPHEPQEKGSGVAGKPRVADGFEGFKVIPGGFFSRNPALDVPR
jgi:hypothetical protein